MNHECGCDYSVEAILSAVTNDDYPDDDWAAS